MSVTLIFHLEPVESGEMVWWAESPGIPGFYATRERLDEVRVVSEMAIRDTLREQGVDADKIEFDYRLADEEDGIFGADAHVEPDHSLAAVA